jgi:hypothetical protein
MAFEQRRVKSFKIKPNVNWFLKSNSCQPFKMCNQYEKWLMYFQTKLSSLAHNIITNTRFLYIYNLITMIMKSNVLVYNYSLHLFSINKKLNVFDLNNFKWHYSQIEHAVYVKYPMHMWTM